MSEQKGYQEKRKFRLQVVTLCLILLPPILLYATVAAELRWITWVLMALIAGGMAMGMWIS